jgi:hypothetical protein
VDRNRKILGFNLFNMPQDSDGNIFWEKGMVTYATRLLCPYFPQKRDSEITGS